MALSRACLVCGAGFTITLNREQTAKYCSRTCAATARRDATGTNTTCTQCGKAFHVKPSQKARYGGAHGHFCSNACHGAFKSAAYANDNNPNFKGRNVDRDGYRLFVPAASHVLGLKRMKLHQAVCCEVLKIQRIPAGFHVHHRDCDIGNNAKENLAVLTVSDHKWLHKQYGVAVLWAFCRGKISLEELVSWSDDHERAKRLLPLDVTMQVGTLT